MSFPNVYAHRKVADTASRGCDVCYRPTTSVLLSEGAGAKDFFFVCPAHLKDSKFCTAIVDQDAEARKKKAMDDEVERVRREYEERKKKAAEKNNEKGQKSEEKDDKEGEKKDDEKKDKDKSKDQEGDDKTNEEDPKKGDSASTPNEEHRFFALQRVFFNQRVSKKREADMAKRNRERLQQPGLFPSVPKNLPGS